MKRCWYWAATGTFSAASIYDFLNIETGGDLMRDLLLVIALLGFICLGFPVMKRLDRFLNENFKGEKDRHQTDKQRTGK